MGSFYSVASVLRIVFADLSLVSFLIQTVSFLLFAARAEAEHRALRLGFEAALAAHLALMAFLLTVFQDQTLQGNAALSAHTAVRWADGFTVCLGIGCALSNKHPRRASTALAAVLILLTLPCFDALPGRAFAWVFMGSVIFFLLRGANGIDQGWRHLSSHVSLLSIKEAVDTLHGGVLFATPKGRIVLQNRSMLSLLHRIVGKSVPDAATLWDRLREAAAAGAPKTERDEKLLFCLPDSAWEFSRETVAAGTRAYLFIHAADVTETHRVTGELAAVTHALEESAGELQYLLEHYEEIKSAREAVNLRRRIHDVMGQRVSILNQALLGTCDPQSVLSGLSPLLSDLLAEIRQRESDPPGVILSKLERSFALAGARLELSGELPEDQERALLLVHIIREAATNAIRHAFATQVFIQIRDTPESCVLTVSDNGQPPGKEIAEGGGITGMRERLKQAGGTLRVESAPSFQLTATLPKS